MKSKIAALVSICLLALALAVPALAGGWASITLEELPTGVIAGEPLTIRFAVRQHGVTLLPGLTPIISARNPATGEATSAKATPVEGQVGRYEASLTFPASGSWEWSIQAFTMNQRMPDLVVSASAQQIQVAEPAPSQLPITIGIGGLVVVLAAAALAIRKQPRWALGMVILGLLVGGAGLASAANKGNKPEMPANASQKVPLNQTGQALFVAKGCVTCHANNRIDNKYYDFRSDIGPNLSQYAASPEFLRMWLKDPVAVKPNTEMPNLDLDEAEIEALVAFLSDIPNAAKSPATATPAAEQVVTATPGLGQVVPIQKAPTGEVAACSNLDRSRGLLVSYTGDKDSYLALVDPATGETLCGVDRIDPGLYPVYAFAPGRSAMLALGQITSTQTNWRVRWIDLKAWTAVDTGVVLDGWPQGLDVNPQRTQVAITYTRVGKDAQQKMLGYNLAQVDLSGKSDMIKTELDIMPRLVAYIGDGKTILVYGASYDFDKETTTSRAKIRLYNASDLKLIWETELSGVLEGYFNTGDSKQFNPDQMAQWQPALALSFDREKLYVVHADADQLTTVDLAAQRWSTAEIQPRLSWLERLLRLTSSVAHAKVLNGTFKWAALSTDSARLYVTGFTGQPKKDQQGGWQSEMLPFGFQVIDTADGSEIARMNNGASEISLSADGTTIFLRSNTSDKPWTDVLDAATLKTIKHVDRQLLYPVQTLSGENWIVGSPEGQWVHLMNVFEEKGFSPVSKIPGKGYFVSTP